MISCRSAEVARTWRAEILPVSPLCRFTAGGSGIVSIAAKNSSKQSKHAITYRSFTVPSKKKNPLALVRSAFLRKITG
jgi:hypothetical protein